MNLRKERRKEGELRLLLVLRFLSELLKCNGGWELVSGGPASRPSRSFLPASRASRSSLPASPLDSVRAV